MGTAVLRMDDERGLYEVQPVASVELITPEYAESLLQANTVNYRKLRTETAAKYASDMTAGRWTLTTDGIGVDALGRVTNGQHRLEAVRRSGVACYFVIVRDLPTDASADPNQDTGQRRNVATHLAAAGIKNGTICAAAVRCLWRIRRMAGISPDWTPLTDGKVAELVETHPTIVRCASSVIPAKQYTSGSVAAAWYWLALRDDIELAESALSIFTGAVDATQRHPFVKLREELLRVRNTKKTRGEMPQEVAVRYWLHAWDKVKRGETVKVLRPTKDLPVSDAMHAALAAFGRD